MSDVESTEGTQASATSGECLSQHPRVVRLRQQVAALPVGQEYRNKLLHSIDLYADHIVARPVYAPEEGWDDLEALQQVTLSDRMEMLLQQQFKSKFQH